MKKVLALAVAAVVLATVPAAAVDFTTYVALGDSLTAGYASGGLAQPYQEGSYPALLARQAGAPVFEQPLVEYPGIPPVLILLQLYPGPVLAPASEIPGNPLNAEYPYPYNNLGVPGADLYDLLFTTGDIYNLLAGNLDNVMYDLILRDGEHTALEQAIGLDPTFLTLWIGNNDVLGAAVYATPIDGVTMTPVANFEQMYNTVAAALAGHTSADMVFINLPDVTAIPFITTLKPFIELPDGSHVPLIGSKGPLPEDAYVTLGASSLLAQGIGIPVELGGTGIPLPEDLQITAGGVIPGVVLRQDEVAVINDRVAAFNDIIAAAAESVGAKVFDVNAFFNKVAAGELWAVGGLEIGTDYLVGGLFSYDGVHPQSIGYGIIAAELIDFINEAYDLKNYGGEITNVNMYEIMTGSAEDQPVPTPLTTADIQRLFTPEAFQTLQRVFAPRLENYHRTPRQGGRVAPELGVKPKVDVLR